jgi:hypothetical protein
MKASKKEGAGRKKKARAKSKVIQKKSSVLSIPSEQKSNKHHSYIKMKQNKETDAWETIAKDSEDKFYMGTYDGDLTLGILNQILNICFKGEQSSESKAISMNASMASLLEIDPQDSTELMLGAQMVTAHNVAMEMARRALMVDGQTDEVVNFNVNRMTKLMRTYTAQVEALNKYRNKGKQKITVKHQHVNVNDGGQAVIGDINQGEGDE